MVLTEKKGSNSMMPKVWTNLTIKDRRLHNWSKILDNTCKKCSEISSRTGSKKVF